MHDNPTEKLGCNAPWFELNLDYSGRISCCCFYGGNTDTWDNESPHDLEYYWNSIKMQQVRSINTSAITEDNTGCSNCSYFQFKTSGSQYMPGFHNIPIGLTPQQENNWKQAVDDYQHRRIKVNSYPIRYYFNFGLHCNLSCIMCLQRADRKIKKKQLNSDILLKWKPYFIRGNEIWIVGGEPFAIPQALHFIKAIVADSELSSVCLYLYTNATRLHEYMELLKSKKKIAIQVSLDSIGETYEHIRKGGSWAQVERNLLTFKEVGLHNNLDWRVITSNIVMKSSLPTLVDLVDWSIQHNIKPFFNDFISVPSIQSVFEVENIFAYPKLLDKIPEWESILSEASEKLESNGWSDSASTLNTMKETLQRRHEETKGTRN
jgi:sulfatase maturation enzyme AslB (radical SAM superfamily)